MSEILCDTPGCGKPSNLRCPTCISKNIKEGSNFCAQVIKTNILAYKSFSCVYRFLFEKKECFKKYWSIHKLIHSPYNPWPNYPYTGPLRPARLVRYLVLKMDYFLLVDLLIELN